MEQVENLPGKGKGCSFAKSKKSIPRIDMTPMVDLGFLLIAFFVFTTSLSKPMATDLYMPKEGDSTNISDQLSMTVLLDHNNSVCYYYGNWEEAKTSGNIFKTNYSTWQGLGRVIREKQKDIQMNAKDPKELMLIVKPLSRSSYKNVVDVLDEIMINDVRKYAIVDPGKNEIEYLKNKDTSGK